MGQMEDLRLFTFVVDNRGISKAADKLNIAKSAVSRRLNLLEERFGATLIDRSPGRWEVTEIGRELYQRASRAVNDFEEIEADFKSAHSDISGPLAISVPRDFGISFLGDVLVGFKRKYPEIHLTVDFDDRLIDLDRDNYDFAIRITPNIDAKLVIEKIGVVKHHLCAAPRYFDNASTPLQLSDLKGQKLLHFGTAKRGMWAFLSEDNKRPVFFEFSPTLNSNSGQFLLEAALLGQGIANLPDFILGDTLEKGELITLLPEFRVADYFICLIRSEHRRLNRRMRLFSQEIKSACKHKFDQA